MVDLSYAFGAALWLLSHLALRTLRLLAVPAAALQAPPASAATKPPALPVRKSTEVGAGVIRQAKGPDGTRGFARFRAKLPEPPAADEPTSVAEAQAADQPLPSEETAAAEH